MVACGGGDKPMTGPDGGSTMPGAGAGSINGIVSDIGTGARVAGATVTGGGQTATTDASGEFTLTGLASGKINISISKAGFAPSFATARAGDSADAVIAWLKHEGTPQPYNATQATTLSQKTEAGPYAVIFQPGTLDTSDTNLMVSITPLDPTKERQALPGNLVSGGASPAPLIPVTFAEFTITDSKGVRVNLKPSASAIVELPLPPALRASYPAGTKIHCYAYDAATGAWEDFVEGTVQTSSVDGVSPVLAAQVRHFSWYGGAPQGNNCVDVPVKVVSVIDGRPLGNARVEASPGTVSYTDADGNATITTIASAETGDTTYTAYLTGVDDDGSLTGIKGAKFIEFGTVNEQAMGSPTSCSGSSRSPGASATAPLVIKIGVVKNAVYSAFGQMTAGNGSSTGSALVILSFGVPGPDGELVNPMPASGAKITLAATGGAQVVLAELAPGSGQYVSTAGLAISPGKGYTLQIDGDGNGSVDGAGTAFAVGDLTWVQPADGANVAAAGLTAMWTDSAAAGNPGYAPVYEAIVSGTDVQDATFYLGTAPQFAVTSTTTDQPLQPGSYTASLIGFSGFAPQVGGGIQLSNNITGAGVTGTFFSVATGTATVSFTVH
ncbi:MAG TPA: carboxypeptidase-like regulatory domain-containing protein [Kofleriaceae bacterium]|nr:carboxypeptidase-like regulatory domain-containing protein [Kofleriaceae bacterium]